MSCYSVSEGELTGDQNRILRLAWAMVADIEGSRIAERAQDSVDHRMGQGHWVGPAPWGYRWAGGETIEPEPAEAVRYREAVNRLMSGENASMVCRGWNSEGLPAPRGDRWIPTTLCRALRNPAYVGRLKNGAPGKHEPLLDQATWEALQLRLDTLARSNGFSFRARGRWDEDEARPLLVGLVRCAVCGGPMCCRILWTGVAGEFSERLVRLTIMGRERRRRTGGS